MEVVPDRCQCGDEIFASRGQRKNTEFVDDVLSIGNGGEQPVEVVLVNALGEKRDDFKEVTGMRAEFEECGGSERELDRCRQALVIGTKDLCPVRSPLLGQFVVVPHIVQGSGSEKHDRQGVEV